jgi:hypothetical protein
VLDFLIIGEIVELENGVEVTSRIWDRTIPRQLL